MVALTPDGWARPFPRTRMRPERGSIQPKLAACVNPDERVVVSWFGGGGAAAPPCAAAAAHPPEANQGTAGRVKSRRAGENWVFALRGRDGL